MPFSPETLTLTATDSGFLSVFDGKRSLLSRYRPDEEARKRFAAAEFSPGQPLLILGDPLGYYAAAAFENDCTPLLVVYPGKRFRQAAVFNTENSRCGKPLLATDFEDPNAEKIIETFLRKYTPKLFEVITLESYFPADFTLFRNLILNRLQQIAVDESVRLAFSRSWLSNAFGNFRSPAPIGHFLWNAKTPILIVAPGPSLEIAVSEIRRFRNRFLLVAVASAGAILKAHGIEVDFYFATDPGFYAKALCFFLPPPRCGWLLPPTAATFYADRTSIQLFRQQMIAENPGGAAFTEQTLPTLKEAPTVTASAHLFFLPFEKTAFVGLDLGADSGKPYARGHDTALKADRLATRLKPAESFFAEALFRRHSTFFLDWFIEAARQLGQKPIRLCAPTPHAEAFQEDDLSWFATLNENTALPPFCFDNEKATQMRKNAETFLNGAIEKINKIQSQSEISSLPEEILSAAAAEAISAQNGALPFAAFKTTLLRRFRRWSDRVR